MSRRSQISTWGLQNQEAWRLWQQLPCPHSWRNWLRTSFVHFPQQVATPSWARKSAKVWAPSAMVADIWRVVTALQTQTYIRMLRRRRTNFYNENYYQHPGQMQVVRICMQNRGLRPPPTLRPYPSSRYSSAANGRERKQSGIFPPPKAQSTRKRSGKRTVRAINSGERRPR